MSYPFSPFLFLSFPLATDPLRMVTVTESRSSGVLKAKNLENPYLFSKIHMDTIRNILLMVYNSCALISHTSKVRLKILQARLQQYVNHELPDAKAGFKKGRGTRDQIANIHWIIKKARVPEKMYFCFINYAKAFDCVDHSKLWKFLQQMEIPGHLTCLLRNLYADQEATVRTGHGTTDWFHS